MTTTLAPKLGSQFRVESSQVLLVPFADPISPRAIAQFDRSGDGQLGQALAQRVYLEATRGRNASPVVITTLVVPLRARCRTVDDEAHHLLDVRLRPGVAARIDAEEGPPADKFKGSVTVPTVAGPVC